MSTISMNGGSDMKGIGVEYTGFVSSILSKLELQTIATQSESNIVLSCTALCFLSSTHLENICT